MLIWSIQTIILSIILIFLVHHLIVFFKNTLTIPKIKDLVNSPIEKYKNMYDVISNPRAIEPQLVPNLNVGIDDEREIKHDLSAMKNELKSFLKKQFKSENENNIPNSTDISQLSSNYSIY